LLLNKKELHADDVKTYNMIAPSIPIIYHEVEPAPHQLKFSWPASEFHIRIMLSLSLDKVTHTRVTYSLVQMIADIGGLLSFLFTLCSFVIKGCL
jgi:hypothetical protein